MTLSLEAALRSLAGTKTQAKGERWPSRRYQNDPVAFAREVLGIEQLWDKQIEMLEAARDHKRVAVRAGQKVSKSHTLAIIALWFYCSFPDARVVATCVTARQVDEVFYRECRKMHRGAKMKLDGEPCSTAAGGIHAPDAREIVGFTARETEAVAGFSGANIFFLLDEASGIAREIFEAMRGNTAGGGRILMTSNPTQTEGVFFEAFSPTSKWKQIHISALDSPNVKAGRTVIPALADLEWVNEIEAEYGKESAFYQVRVLGNFVKTETGKIISLHLITLAQERWHETEAVGRLHVGLDPAGPGEAGDEVTMSARRGLKQTRLTAARGLDEYRILLDLLDLLATEKKPREVPVVVVDGEGPIGTKVLTVLRAHLEKDPRAFELVDVRSSNKAFLQPWLYGTVRDELWAQAAKWLREGGAILSDTKLAADIHAPAWHPIASYGTQAAKLKATDKKELRKKLNRSPDRGDAWTLSVWEPRPIVVETDDGAVALPTPHQPSGPYQQPTLPGRSSGGPSPYTTTTYGRRR